MRIGLAQINSVLGDFAANREKILQFTKRALEIGCDLVVFPELCLMGYIPNDLLERETVVQKQWQELAVLFESLPDGISILVGIVGHAGAATDFIGGTVGLLSGQTRTSALVKQKTKTPGGGKKYYNSAVLLEQGKAPRFFHKQLLPTYDVFDEARHQTSGTVAKNLFQFRGRTLLLTICEDIWASPRPGRHSAYAEDPIELLRRKIGKKKIDLILNMSASPFTHEKLLDRKYVVGRAAKTLKAPLAYINLVGGQDEIIFDGGSFAVDKNGKMILQSPAFEECLNHLDLDKLSGPKLRLEKNADDRTRKALVLGLRDFVIKTGFKRVHLGLSGGIDSALVACLAVDALGKDQVTAVTMPGPFNEERSKKLAGELAQNLGIRLIDMPIGEAYDSLLGCLKKSLGEFEFGVVNENLQARIRGVFLMALSNKENSILLTTGNKSEYATGYATLYGDMCGGLAPIADLLKSEVYSLSRLYNREFEVIPDEIITRPPSAELKPNQRDQDSLPPYDALDQAVDNLVTRAQAAKSETEQWLLPVLLRSEFKRWQAPPILKVSQHAFGRGRRFPVAHKAKV